MPSSSLVEVVSATPSDQIFSVGSGQVSASTDGRVLTFQGWVVGATQPIAEIEIADESDRLIARAPVTMPRPDLASSVIEDASSLATAGFRVVLEAVGAGRDTLRIRAVSTDAA